MYNGQEFYVTSTSRGTRLPKNLMPPVRHQINWQLFVNCSFFPEKSVCTTLKLWVLSYCNMSGPYLVTYLGTEFFWKSVSISSGLETEKEPCILHQLCNVQHWRLLYFQLLMEQRSVTWMLCVSPLLYR